jgi:hypothetical protein
MEGTVVDPGSVQINYRSVFGSRRTKHIWILRMRIRMRMQVLNTGLHRVNYRLPVNPGMEPLTATEPVFLNDYGAPEMIPRNAFGQPMCPGGPVR